MKENENSQIQGVRLPPAWCGSISRNAMNDVCIENCAVKRDCSGFELKPGINLIDMPGFPIDQITSMTKEEKFISVAVYVAKTVDHLKGVQDEPEFHPHRRSNHDSSTGSQVPTNLKVEDILSDLTAGVTSLEVGEKRPSETVGSDGLAESEG
jgi:hypothetical protein